MFDTDMLYCSTEIFHALELLANEMTEGWDACCDPLALYLSTISHRIHCLCGAVLMHLRLVLNCPIMFQDNEAKQAISQLKHKFVENCEAFLHGDLHTGSMMCTPESSLVIDPEFAYYGPMGFDIGSFLANLFLAYFSQVNILKLFLYNNFCGMYV